MIVKRVRSFCEYDGIGKVGNTHGSGNKGKPKSEEHKKNISLNRRGGKPKGWKKDKARVVERSTQQT